MPDMLSAYQWWATEEQMGACLSKRGTGGSGLAGGRLGLLRSAARSSAPADAPHVGGCIEVAAISPSPAAAVKATSDKLLPCVCSSCCCADPALLSGACNCTHDSMGSPAASRPLSVCVAWLGIKTVAVVAAGGCASAAAGCLASGCNIGTAAAATDAAVSGASRSVPAAGTGGRTAAVGVEAALGFLAAAAC